MTRGVCQEEFTLFFASGKTRAEGPERTAAWLFVNPTINRTACEQRLQVHSALRAPTARYGKTKEGECMTQKQAQGKGYRPAVNHPCL